MKIFALILMIFSVNFTFSQHNMLGKTKIYIESFYRLSNTYTLQTDTINKESVLITCKAKEHYPYYTYEINLKDKICVSYGIVSKNKNILDTYLELLSYLGELVTVDSTFSNFTYKIETKDKLSIFSIKKPYINSQFLSRRSLFYILVTEKRKNTGMTLKKNYNN